MGEQLPREPLLNQAQVWIVCAGIGLAMIFSIIVPWNKEMNASGRHIVTPLGYGSIFSPPKAYYEEVKITYENGDPYSRETRTPTGRMLEDKSLSVVVNLPMVLIPIGVIAGCTIGGVLIAANRKR